MKFNVLGFPRVVDPFVFDVLSREVLDVVREVCELLLELVVDDEDGEFSFREVSFLIRSEFAVLLSDILLEFSDSVSESCSRVVDFVLFSGSQVSELMDSETR